MFLASLFTRVLDLRSSRGCAHLVAVSRRSFSKIKTEKQLDAAVKYLKKTYKFAEAELSEAAGVGQSAVSNIGLII